MARKYVFRTRLRWSGSKRGSLLSSGKLNIGVATPPEFNGEEGYWSPEELLLSAVDSCIMTTFLAYAEKEKVGFSGYESATEGALEKIEGHFRFSKITVKPRISVRSEDQERKIKELMKIAEDKCFISNSIKCEVNVMPEVKVRS